MPNLLAASDPERVSHRARSACPLSSLRRTKPSGRARWVWTSSRACRWTCPGSCPGQ
ncbi:hypothetical protein J2S85_005590 [Bradyrhizobium japonicum]|nr:hypothetical protein [Bradyrhizobium japonicum]